jgi:hypothetical protein
MVFARWLAVAIVVVTLAPRSARASDWEEPGTRASDRAPDTSWDLSSSLSGRRYAIRSNFGGGGEIDGTGEALAVELVHYLAPLHDDGAPYSLQPFLQRMNTFSVTVGASHFLTSSPFADRSDWDGSLAASVEFYPRRWLNVAASLGYTYDALHDAGVDEKSHIFSGNGGAGVRIGDTLIRASYYLEKFQVSDASVPLRQGVQLRASTVLARRLSILLFGETIPHGGEGQLTLEYFHGRDLGIFTTALAAEGQLYRTGPSVKRVAGTVGVAGWINTTTALLAQYTLTLEDQTGVVQVSLTDNPGYRETTHALLIELRQRFP